MKVKALKLGTEVVTPGPKYGRVVSVVTEMPEGICYEVKFESGETTILGPGTWKRVVRERKVEISWLMVVTILAAIVAAIILIC